MAINSPNSLGTLTGLRDRMAQAIGADDYAGIAQTERQAEIDNALEASLDRLHIEAELKTHQREGGFVTGFLNDNDTLTGTAIATSDSNNFSDGTATFVTDGVRTGDKLQASSDGFFRVVTVNGEADFDMEPSWSLASDAAVAYTLYRDEFPLNPDVWWLKEIWEMQPDARQIPIVSESQLRRETGDQNQNTGRPEFAMISSPTGSETAEVIGTRIRLWPVPDASRGYRYVYQALPTFPTTAVSESPHMHLLVFHGAMVELWTVRGEADRVALHERHYLRLVELSARRDVNRTRTRVVMRPLFRPGEGFPPFRIGTDPQFITDA